MTHLWGISKAAAEAKVADAEAAREAKVKVKLAPVASPATFECLSTMSGHSKYVTTVSYSFSNVWCVLTIEHFTALSAVFVSVQTANMLLVEAGTPP
jgi:hypothetical protein